MLWLALAVGAQTCGAMAVHLDKIAIDHFVRSYQTTFVLAALCSAGTAAVCVAGWGLPGLQARDMWLALLGGGLFILHVLFYLAALQRYPALSVAVFFQLTPVLGVLMAVIVGDGSITPSALLAILAIAIGSVLFSLLGPREYADDTVVLGVLRYMLPCTLVLAGSAFVLGRVSDQASTSDMIAVTALGTFGVGMVLSVASGWTSLAVRDLRHLPGRALPSVVGAEALAIGYQMLMLGALLVGPAAYVLAIEGVQPLILVLMGVALAAVVPHLVVARPTRRQLTSMVVCSIAILGGVALLAAETS